MGVFAEKLSRLTETIALVADQGVSDICDAMIQGRGRMAVAIGSGGSAVVAEYFSRCRTTLGFGHTLVMTPMQFILSMDEWAGIDIWLFSANANNPDVAAAFKCAVSSRSATIRLITTSASGATAVAATVHPRSEIYVLPVADPKDGFLATHSMIAMITGLLIASDAGIEQPRGAELAQTFLSRATSALGEGIAESVGQFHADDTVIVVHDPQVTAVAVLFETSLWETGIAPIQRADFRNFAHGRHVWAARHPEAMFALALTTRESESVWQPIADALPAAVRRGGFGLEHGGRFSNAVGIVKGLAMIGRLGELAGIDPGRPGRGPFAEAIYDNDALLALADGLTNAVRHKVAATQLHDPADEAGVSLCEIGRDRLRGIGNASFAAIVLDYDGTVVPNAPTEARLGPPSSPVMEELIRLLDGGIRVGFATGRGGSAGGKLRESLPARTHRHILMGYYNGAHIRTLDVDISRDRPEIDSGVAAVAEWIRGAGVLRDGVDLDVGEVQVTINHFDILDRAGFAARLVACPEVATGAVRVLSSQHSFDLVPKGTTKLSVVRQLSCDGPVLGVGDSGSPLGNDRELLSGPHGISVGSVCGSCRGAWTLFGSRMCGPEALLRMLRAARVEDGKMRINLSGLELDRID